MKTILLITSLGLTLSGCSSINDALEKKFGDKGLDGRKVEKEIKTRLEKYDLDGAKQYYASQLKRNLPWCVQQSYQCRSARKRTPQYISAITTDGFQCIDGLIKCKEAAHREDIKECLAAIDRKCRGNYSGWSSKFIREYERYEKTAPNKIVDLKYRSDSRNPLGKYRNKCLKEMQWGYYKTIKSFSNSPVVIRKEKQKFYSNNFSSKSDCDVSFFNTNKNYTRRARPSGCHQRNLGKTVSATVYRAKYMFSYSIDDPIAGNITSPVKSKFKQFSSKSECINAINIGLVTSISAQSISYSPMQDISINIHPRSSHYETRFITGCSKTSKIICRRYGEEIK